MLIGHNKFPDNIIQVMPMRTQTYGLCYKLQFSNPLPDPPNAPLALFMINYAKGIDKLKKIKLLIASNNTWQGIITDNWPYSKMPPLIEQKFTPNVYKVTFVNMEENIWKFRKGDENFNKCIENKDDGKCLSIFDVTFDESKDR